MKKSWSSPFLEGVEKAFLDLRESYQENPLKYMNKWDVIADLHQRLSHLSRLDHVETGRFTIGTDGRWREKKEEVPNLLTTPLHLRLGMNREDRSKADICYVDLSKMQVAATARYSGKRPTSLAAWRISSGVGLSVIYNDFVQYPKRRNSKTGRSSKTEGLKVLENDILNELMKLRLWDKSVLVLVDNHSLYTRTELEATFSRRLDPYTMRMYYLTPKVGYHIAGKRQSKDSLEPLQ